MKTTKAGQLLKVAFATYHQADRDIAKDIFCMAMEDPSAPIEFGENPQELAEQAKQAIDSGDPVAAKALLEAMESVSQDEPFVEDLPEDLPEEEIIDEELDEGAMSPGDEVPPPPPGTLAPASLKPEAVASLVKLAGKIKRDGHPDLAAKIENLLGL